MNSAFPFSLIARSAVDLTALTYVGAFGKLPENAGLNYQVNLLLDGSLTPVALAESLTNSPQFVAMSADMSVAQIVESFYINLLHRPADETGLAFHVAAINSGGTSIGAVLYNFIMSPEALSANAVGIGRYETLAANGQVPDTQTELDNLPLQSMQTDTTPGVITVSSTTVAPTPTFQSHGSIGNALLLNGAGKLQLGDGTTPDSGLVVGSTSAGFSVAMREAPRSSDKVYMPTNISTTANHVTADFNMPSGTQTMANGSFSDNATRTAVSQAFIVGTTGQTFAQAIAAGNTFHLQLDQDGGAGTNYVGTTYIGQVNGTGSIDWINTTLGGDITDNVGNTNTAGNATLVGFHNPAGAAGALTGNVYTDKLWIADSNGVELVGITVNENLIAPGSSAISPMHTI